MKCRLCFKWTAVVVSLLLASSIAISIVSIRQGTIAIRKELGERGVTLARGLAYNSEYGLFTENREILDNLIKGVMEAPDTSYCVIYDKKGNILVSTGDVKDERVRTKAYETRYIKAEDGSYFDIVIPVFTRTTAGKGAEAVLFASKEDWIRETRKSQERAISDGELALFDEEKESTRQIIGFVKVGISELSAMEDIAKLRNSIAGISGLVIFVGISITVGFVNRLIQPIQELSSATQIMAGGDLPRKVTIRRKDEIGMLADSFNKMTDDLQKTIESLDLEITERKRAEEELKEYRDHLEELVKRRTAEIEIVNEELESFSYSVSHDLRSPLTGMDGFSLALLEDYSDRLDDRGKDYLQRIRRASGRMAQLIDDLLGLSRVTRKEMKYEPVPLNKLAKHIIPELQRTQPERKIEFVCPEELSVQGDRNLLDIVLRNLLDNAWKFTEKTANPKIELGVTRTGGEEVFFVRDNGVGFDPAYKDKLFATFQRLHAESEFPGTGIGLATVERIIRRHGGRVWAEGEIDKGATFYFTVPEQEAKQKEV